ncbi:SGNH/GDSL hydrolase family protein [Spirosoma sp. KNUC1025]|uniref:SGNH/GDSL hydrolase family protein n=1 Tax=Spirosoma sp. KNUC1025 TaxID=2894082 RepID=UPI00386627A6|nr:SGNH/GDSL hydrolase family protein [Spirosoma sp. KNUC1025]
MFIQRKSYLGTYKKTVSYVFAVLFFVSGIYSCTSNYPSQFGLPPAPAPPTPTPQSDSAKNCPCPTATPASSTTSAPAQPAEPDTLRVPAPRFSPDGGTFYMSTDVQLAADSLPPQAVIEYSLDDGASWQSGSKFTLTTGGKILTRIRAGTKHSGSRSASFNLYFKRMLIIGNSIMSHAPAPDLGWYNFNGMAASAPDKDFVHLLTANLQSLYPALTVKLQSGGNFEQQFGKPDYSVDEFNAVLQDVKPDLIIVRIGENMDDNQAASRNLEGQFRLLLDKLANYGQPVRIVCTTSVWYKPNYDAIVRKIVPEKGHTLVDLGSMVGQAKCFASEYKNPGVAAHPNDVGMQYIADMIWQKLR